MLLRDHNGRVRLHLLFSLNNILALIICRAFSKEKTAHDPKIIVTDSQFQFDDDTFIHCIWKVDFFFQHLVYMELCRFIKVTLDRELKKIALQP